MTMRVTTFGITGQYLADLNNIMNKYQSDEQQLSTGRKLNQPSDDPVAFESDIRLQSSITQVQQWQSNASMAQSNLNITDSTMSTLQTVLGNVRTQLVQALNGTNNAGDLNSTFQTVSQLVNQVANIASTTDGQSNVFAGTDGKETPVTADTAAGYVQLKWSLSASYTTVQQQSVSMGTNTNVTLGVNGQQLFNSSSGTNLITTLNNIVKDLHDASQSSTQEPNGTALSDLQTQMNNLDANIQNVSSLQADLGGRMSLVTSTQTQLSQSLTTLKTQKGQAEDANLADVITQLTTQQTVYQAALDSGQHLILPTLASVLGSTG